ncbi:MAG: 4a-hydroxytetrahydrobiopterin dehydratase [Kiritimatiellia bacterium]|jgi:4a-hydroxytetrahydrobiopterin dehydratase|nr:4a-hydroxytetrahydrobiopterin dehydratase [Kiritimatiellia bacterium]MDP6847294.1 4a-hydroxytetrahydrobiopterin dehydratase [Kiritimatiellia bacterium]
MNNESDGTCSLADLDCVPCRGGIPPLEGDRLRELSDSLGGGWVVVKDHHLVKVFSFPDFRQALTFTNMVGELAETIGHHPSIELSWGKVVVTIWTHKIDGLAEADFIFAAKVDQLD